MNTKREVKNPKVRKLYCRSADGDIGLLARNLKVARNRRGVSQAWVAQRVGVTVNQIGHYETGRGVPDSIMLYDLCRIYRVAMDSMFSEEVS